MPTNSRGHPAAFGGGEGVVWPHAGAQEEEVSLAAGHQLPGRDEKCEPVAAPLAIWQEGSMFGWIALSGACDHRAGGGRLIFMGRPADCVRRGPASA